MWLEMLIRFPRGKREEKKSVLLHAGLSSFLHLIPVLLESDPWDSEDGPQLKVAFCFTFRVCTMSSTPLPAKAKGYCGLCGLYSLLPLQSMAIS
jgi:hypothetical protein